MKSRYSVQLKFIGLSHGDMLMVKSNKHINHIIKVKDTSKSVYASKNECLNS